MRACRSAPEATSATALAISDTVCSACAAVSFIRSDVPRSVVSTLAIVSIGVLTSAFSSAPQSERSCSAGGAGIRARSTPIATKLSK